MSDTAIVTAALVVIGNEILSGKIEETNAHYLAQGLFEMGWELREITVIPDDTPTVVSALKRLSADVDHVFTSGGVGPTHDDITLAAVALATGRELVLSPVLETLLKRFLEVEFLTPAQQRLAIIPEGATLHYGESSKYPQMIVDNIYPLPGIPELFRKKFDQLKELWPPVKARGRKCLKLEALETDVAELLAGVADRFPKVSLGSYPSQKDGAWWLELVLESRDEEELENAFKALTEVLGVPAS